VATKKTSTAKPEDLTPREGKVLRFLVGRKRKGDTQTATDECIVERAWSDLPHNHAQAVQTVSSLKAKGLLVNVSKGHYTPTEAGVRLMEKAEKANLWLTSPPPSVTNNPEHIDPVLKPYKKAPKAKASK
jgi:hypothetical protein